MQCDTFRSIRRSSFGNRMLILVLEANHWIFFQICCSSHLNRPGQRENVLLALLYKNRVRVCSTKLTTAEKKMNASIPFQKKINKRPSRTNPIRRDSMCAHGNEKIQNSPRRTGLIVWKTSHIPTIANVLIAVGRIRRRHSPKKKHTHTANEHELVLDSFLCCIYLVLLVS